MLRLDFVHTTYKIYGYFVRVTTTCREASGAATTFTTCRAICYLEGQSSHNVAARWRAGSGPKWWAVPSAKWALPGDHGAGVGLAGRGGGGTELRETAVAGLQAGHGASVSSTGRGGMRTHGGCPLPPGWTPLPRSPQSPTPSSDIPSCPGLEPGLPYLKSSEPITSV